MRKFVFWCLIVSLCLCFCGCSVDFTPFKTHVSDAKPAKVYNVYVFGAVAEEGYGEVAGGADYSMLVEEAGIIAQTYLPDFPYTLVKSTTKQLAVNYFDGENMCYCVNVNGPLITLRMNVENVSPQVVDKLADYIEEHGKITDKTLLKQILGEDYADNYYKFFVSMDDYEKIG